ncbi:unnamed protein product [[Candida] boidinii]|uniref:Unnamed protein product n=1 Tax=Candida boidinii TaxID=5477 RepID=A0A9W6SYG9_CANBO|nr:unnamed protein product [[Candida] boidinii]
MSDEEIPRVYQPTDSPQVESTSSQVSEVNSIPILIDAESQRGRRRRSSIFDIGGANSINNFASSLQRSANFGKLTATNTDTISTNENAVCNSPLLSPVSSGSHMNEYETLYQPQRRLNEVPLPLNSSDSETHIPTESTPLIFDANKNIDLPFDVLVGKSTAQQTTFNSVNVLIGLGVLSLPLGLHLGGWVLGTFCLTASALSTRYTAVLLGRVLRKQSELQSYYDIAKFTLGSSISAIVFVTFAIDLFGAAVSMVILFSDSFSATFTEIKPYYFNVSLCALLIFINLLPLNILSFLSFIGISCTSSIVILLLVCGFIKGDQSPGSLLSPMPTNLWPSSLKNLLISVGIFMAPWGGHAVYPELFRDMRHPSKYEKCVDSAFGFSYFVDLLTGILGFLMFGVKIDEEVTRSILTTSGYPEWISKVLIVLMGVLPIAKLPLVSRPLVTFGDQMFGSVFQKLIHKEETTSTQSYSNNATTGDAKLYTFSIKLFTRILISAAFLIASLLITSFGKVMSLLGSGVCFTICITLPVLFYIIEFKSELKTRELSSLYAIIFVSVGLTICGTTATLMA